MDSKPITEDEALNMLNKWKMTDQSQDHVS